MDEVFYIGSDKCPRCKGKGKAKLIAATRIGMWEASKNNTHAAVDMIPKVVIILRLAL
jgi:hypothetical protein